MRYLRTKHLYLIVLYAVTLHLIWAVALYFDETVAGVTAISSIKYIMPGTIAIPVMVSVALLALFAFVVERAKISAMMMIPQQFILFISAGGALQAMIEGHYADGVMRPYAFLIADQSPAILTAIGHTIAIILVARTQWNGPN